MTPEARDRAGPQRRCLAGPADGSDTPGARSLTREHAAE